MKDKKYILRFNSSNKNSRYSFEALKDRTKRVETRAATERYRKINAGDTLVFVCGKDRFKKKVKRVKSFKSISSMLRIYKVKDITPDLSTKEELVKAYDSYTGYKEKIGKFGIIAFEL